MNTLKHAGIAVLTAIVLAVAGCGDGNPIGPSNQPEINNVRDSFQFQASNLDETSQTLTYTWENTGTSANVNQSGQISGGSATLTLSDGAGTQVYSRTLAETGTFTTSVGAAGSWRIEVRLREATGTVNFRVQKP